MSLSFLASTFSAVSPDFRIRHIRLERNLLKIKSKSGTCILSLFCLTREFDCLRVDNRRGWMEMNDLIESLLLEPWMIDERLWIFEWTLFGVRLILKFTNSQWKIKVLHFSKGLTLSETGSSQARAKTSLNLFNRHFRQVVFGSEYDDYWVPHIHSFIDFIYLFRQV